MTAFGPVYLALRVRGELARRVREAWAHLEACDLCARYCRVNRRVSTKGAVWVFVVAGRTRNAALPHRGRAARDDTLGEEELPAARPHQDRIRPESRWTKSGSG